MKKLLLLLPLISLLIVSCSKDDDEKLSTPTLTTPANNANLQANAFVFDFAWSNVANATEYVIQVSQNSNFATSSSTTVASNEVELTVNNAETGTYYWRVQAKAPGFANSDFSSAFVINFTKTGGPTSEITLLTPADNGTAGTRPTFTWTELPNASTTFYEIEVAQDFTFGSIFRTYQSVGTSYTVPGTAPEIPVGAYYWRVKKDGVISNYHLINIE
jgi:hypothetical protein